LLSVGFLCLEEKEGRIEWLVQFKSRPNPRTKSERSWQKKLKTLRTCGKRNLANVVVDVFVVVLWNKIDVGERRFD
jgi:hypothetical protein